MQIRCNVLYANIEFLLIKMHLKGKRQNVNGQFGSDAWIMSVKFWPYLGSLDSCIGTKAFNSELQSLYVMISFT